LGRDGALAEELVLPELCLVDVPESVTDEQAVFAEPLAAALHVCDELEAGDEPIVVLGDGKLGQLIARALVATGASVTLVGHHEHKMALVRALGAATRLESECESLLGNAGLVVEATGSMQGFARALELVRPRGKIVLKTTLASALEVDLAPIVINELRIIGSRCGNLRRAIDVLASQKLDLTPLISARYPLHLADQALREAARKGTLKVVVEGLMPARQSAGSGARHDR
jgi:threonine dehydrogenase-like Zn-dependent dehydrogenase